MLLLLLSLLSSTPDRCAIVVSRAAIADSILATRPMVMPYARTIDSIAIAYHLPAALLAGVIQEESRFDPWATRVEPAYLASRKVRRAALLWTHSHTPLPNAATERADRARSFGLMQVMGEVAREQGYHAPWLATLYLPERSIAEGARLLARLLTRYHGDTLAAISAYNQGSARKKRGLFANARYVYRVAAAWRFYEPLFAGRERER